MAKPKRERIEKRLANIAAAEQRVQAENEKIGASRNRIKVEQQRISRWKKEIHTLRGELLAEQLQASNLTLDDALAAMTSQEENAP